MVEVQVEGSRFGGRNRQSESVKFRYGAMQAQYGCACFAGMKGNPIRGLLFNHVAFFKGEMSVGGSRRADQAK